VLCTGTARSTLSDQPPLLVGTRGRTLYEYVLLHNCLCSSCVIKLYNAPTSFTRPTNHPGFISQPRVLSKISTPPGPALMMPHKPRAQFRPRAKLESQPQSRVNVVVPPSAFAVELEETIRYLEVLRDILNLSREIDRATEVCNSWKSKILCRSHTRHIWLE
jgi:hypothetical protein